MDIIRKTVGEDDYTFYCESLNTRSGFKHVVRLYKNGREIAENTSHYLNRTWESYRYKTCMLGAVGNLQTQLEHDFMEKYKAKHGIKRLTAKKREFAENLLNMTKEYAELEKLYDAVRYAKYGTEDEKNFCEALDMMISMFEILKS